MCVLSIKVPIRKKSANLFNDPYININIGNIWKLEEIEYKIKFYLLDEF